MSFDAEVKVGEIRVFADTKEPLVAAVVESRGLAGWRIVPVSSFREPVNESELKIGERVFQLWNVCTASKNFVTRSWVADTLSPTELERLASALATARPLGRLGDYERRALAVGGDFAGWRSKFPARRKWVWPTASWAAAAMVLVSVGVFFLLPQEQEKAASFARVMTVQMERPEPEIAVVKCDADVAEPEMQPAPVAIDLQVERAQVPRIEPAPDVRRLAKAPQLRAPVKTRLKGMKRNVVEAKPASSGGEIARTLAELKGLQQADGSWGRKPVKDTALAVLAMMANGETSDSAEYGKSLADGVRYLTEADLTNEARQDVQIAACALCCATAAVRNPNIRAAAEKALELIGDRRSVEAGRDWSGILVDLAQPSRTVGGAYVAAEAPEKDAIAEASVYVLRLIAFPDEP